MYRIPVYQPDLSGREREYVLDCIDSTWISSKGRFLGEFEQAFANWTGSPHAAAVSNGTVALHLALLAAGIGPGDEVLVPTLTYVASVNAIRYVGATPVFVDSLADTWQLSSASLLDHVGPRTRAVLAVHLYGGSCDLHALAAVCEQHGLVLIEDCAEAIGTRYQGAHVGTFGLLSTFSFFGNKTITTGEGGMVLSRLADVDERVRHLRGQGLAPDREYWHDVVGYNYRMTNICAAIGAAQLERIDSILEMKRRLADAYRQRLADTPLTFQAQTTGEEPSYWMVTVLTPTAELRDPLRTHLAEAGVETRPIFHPVHTMPMYRSGEEAFPIATDIAARGINLPSWHRLPDDALDTICDHIRKFFSAR
ncbi:aminotransferase class I/II-fold pyridoxal phosphate-dependent enzyme [Lysobacter sp. TY2-98]|uniref:DegT/DnrJ/EryC1/StrS family aminotransferase n=1 Tax=Lysobacter sp. TY2-98 TaxID=2290922 RepID=UPI000E202BDF|nr:aminotransferase class I/II-fold pyridoxal phosphate-dependent enzyme [Lysobacter sp. TY2-98]AXK70984.1 aminotransferase class I/II-fold pyridoxal phosphate-dependent enzyme [Lysobacter sp. TY2-98]